MALEESTHLLRDLVIGVTLDDPNRALRAGVTSIDLGVLGNRVNEIFIKTLLERKDFEAPVLVTSDRRLLLSENRSVDPNSPPDLDIKSSDPELPKTERQSKFLVANIHVHSRNIPAELADIVPLLASDRESHYAVTAVIVGTPNYKFVIFRGETTPQLNSQEYSDKLKLWYEVVQERIKRYTSPEMTEREIREISDKAHVALLRDIAKTYDLQVFGCPRRENVATRFDLQTLLNN